MTFRKVLTGLAAGLCIAAMSGCGDGGDAEGTTDELRAQVSALEAENAALKA